MVKILYQYGREVINKKDKNNSTTPIHFELDE